MISTQVLDLEGAAPAKSLVSRCTIVTFPEERGVRGPTQLCVCLMNPPVDPGEDEREERETIEFHERLERYPVRTTSER